MKKLLIGILSAIFSLAAYSANPTDPEIAKIVINTNKGEIALAELAKMNSQNAQVKNFAEQMIQDHKTNNQKTMELAKKLKMNPEDNAKSQELKHEGDKAMTMLKDLKGPSFDKAYMDNQVHAHQKVLNNFDKTLIPSAKNPELKSMLTATREKVSQQMEHAKHIQSTL